MESIFYYEANRADLVFSLDHFPIAIGVSGCGIDDADDPLETTVVDLGGIGTDCYEWHLVLFGCCACSKGEGAAVGTEEQVYPIHSC